MAERNLLAGPDRRQPLPRRIRHPCLYRTGRARRLDNRSYRHWPRAFTAITGMRPIQPNPGTTAMPLSRQFSRTLTSRSIPRFRAILNAVYQGRLAMSEWSAAFAGESDFSTALGDADASVFSGGTQSDWPAGGSAGSRKCQLSSTEAYRNYDGSHHTFDPISVARHSQRRCRFASASIRLRMRPAIP